MLRRLTTHGAALFLRAEKFDLFQLALEIGKEGVELLLGRRRRTPRHVEGQFRPALQLEPFVADDHHRLREIKRGEGRIDRQRDDGVRQRHLVVFQPVALAAEDDGDVFAGGDARRRFRRRRVGADHGLGLVVIARGRRQHERAIADRALQACHKLCAPSSTRSAPAAMTRAFSFGQGLHRRNQPQAAEAEIGHGARRRADVLAHLRLDQNDDRRRLLDPALGLVGAGARHGSTPPLRRYSCPASAWKERAKSPLPPGPVGVL